MNDLPKDYDAWRLAGPDTPDPVGTEDGDLCNRWPEPDEDAPRNYRPKQCHGSIIEKGDGAFSVLVCDVCGATP